MQAQPQPQLLGAPGSGGGGGPPQAATTGVEAMHLAPPHFGPRRWSHGIWACNPCSTHCCMATFCPCALLARLRFTQRLLRMWPRSADFVFVLTLYALVYTVAYASLLTDNAAGLLGGLYGKGGSAAAAAGESVGRVAAALRIPGFVADVGVLFLLTQLRAYYRLQNDIAERDACLDNDCMCACFCGCCVLVQVADDSTADHWVAAEGSNASADKASCCEMLSCEAPTDVR